MKKLLIGVIVFVALACGIFVYTEQENRKYAQTLPKPPVVEQIIDGHTHPALPESPHPHEALAQDTDLSNVKENTALSAEENTVATDTEQIAEEDTEPVDAGSQNEGFSQSGTAWQKDDEHEHQPTQDPFAKRKNRIEDMDPDALADMILVGLLEKFGDIAEVHTFVAFTRKIKKNEELNLDERISFTEASIICGQIREPRKPLRFYWKKELTKGEHNENSQNSPSFLNSCRGIWLQCEARQ